MLSIRGRKRRRTFSDYLSLIVLSVAFIIVITPVFWTFLNSLKPIRDMGAYPPKLIFSPTLDHYKQIFSRNIWLPLRNSIAITFGSVLVAVLAGSPAGYALARFHGRAFRSFGFFVLSLRFLPAITFILPLFLLYRDLALTGTLGGLIVAYQVFLLPLVVWLTWGFFSQIPVELEEAAIVDGCSRLSAFYFIVLPLALPGIISAAIIASIWSWNEFFTPIILAGRTAETLPVALARWTGGEGMLPQWGPLAAWSMVIIAPVLLFALALSRYLVAGFLRLTQE